jgi:hypothetical protein
MNIYIYMTSGGNARLQALGQNRNLEDQVPVLMSPSDRVYQLHPQALGSLFVAL